MSLDKLALIWAALSEDEMSEDELLLADLPGYS